MTAYLARRRLEPAQQVEAAPYDPLPGESLMGLEPGELVSVRDLLYGLLLASGNDAAETLAVASDGSVEAFVEEMNGAAAKLGLGGTSYANPVGLDDPGGHSTAADLAILTRRLRDDPLIRRIVDTPRIVLADPEGEPRRLVNRNNLVREIPWISGVKTGYTDGAGEVLVASADAGPAQLVSVVLGAPTEADRDAASLELLRWGRSLYDERTAVESGERLGLVTVPGAGGIPLVAERELVLVAREGQRIDVAVEGPGPRAAVSAGERLGEATVTLDGRPAGKVALVAERSAATPEPPAPEPDWPLFALIAIGGLLVVGAILVIFRYIGGHR